MDGPAAQQAPAQAMPMTSQTPAQRLNRSSNDIFEETGFLFGEGGAFVEALYAQYLADPDSVDPSWRDYFAGLGEAPARAPQWARRKKHRLSRDEETGALTGALTGVSASDAREAARQSVRAVQLVRAYRIIGHFEADLDPLKLAKKAPHPQLDPLEHGFTAADLDKEIFLDGVLGLESVTPRRMVDILRRTYCGRIGYEFMHINDAAEKDWLQRRIEGPDKEISFTDIGRKAILGSLIAAEGFEKFCALRFLGTKRFGLDGGEAMIPALEQIIKRGGQMGVKEIVLGMAHRGRLNVLANVMAKPYRQIFNEFQGGSSTPSDVQGSGDVKYHLGASSDRAFDGNHVHLSLTPNPSHLEASDPVVLGKVRAKQAQHSDTSARDTVLPLLLHGDAAFSGQGVVAECFAMSGTKGFRTGGTIHFVINNQIGFTTAPQHSRSSAYCTDLALIVQAPILHVNGDDPEAVVHAARIATEFRQIFHKDVVVDMFCYRRFGHNETDEPSFTQPLMYRVIKDHPTTLEVYAGKLIGDGTVTEDEFKAMAASFNRRLDEEFEAAKSYEPSRADWLDGRWQGFTPAPKEGDRRGTTGVDADTLREVGRVLTTVPEGFDAHKTILRQLQAKAHMFETGAGFDWATAEALAFGTLLKEGCAVRLSGQDSGRGTFSQRHAVLVDQGSEERYVPLAHVAGDEGMFEVVDSLLSEEAVLGFEYGYSTAEPKTLVLWEAQFGDFANGAQVIIDQFITSGEMKWLRMSGLVLLLPHGYEGQGPEHSSARLERYLQLCAQDNIQVCYPTTPANYFHVLRRQMHREFRKPLVLMTPKSLLRNKRCTSFLEDFTPKNSFHRIFRDQAEVVPGATPVKLAPDGEIKRVILCTGKVYFDLMEAREKQGQDKVQVIRLEQLYPFPENPLIAELKRFPKAEIVWCQEEPKNQGAWTFVRPRIQDILTRMSGFCRCPRYVGRPEYASTAAGLMSRHNAELKAFLEEAMTL
jgi:2-oxoglutarate dehydrogenase E1 component